MRPAPHLCHICYTTLAPLQYTGGMRTPNKLAAGAAVATGLALSSCGSHEPAPPSPTEGVNAFCTSKPVFSPWYPGDPGATTDRSTWKKGIIISLPPLKDRTPSAAAIVSYETNTSDPTSSTADWHESQPVDFGNSERPLMIAAKIGPTAVSLSLRVSDKADAGLCNEVPRAIFSAELPWEVASKGAALPVWLSGS